MPSLRQCHEVGWQAVSAWALAPSARVSSSGLVTEDGLIRACGEEAATRGSTRRRVPRMQATEPAGQRITSRSRFSMTNPDCAGDALVSRTPNAQRHAGIAACLQPPAREHNGLARCQSTSCPVVVRASILGLSASSRPVPLVLSAPSVAAGSSISSVAGCGLAGP